MGRPKRITQGNMARPRSIRKSSFELVPCNEPVMDWFLPMIGLRNTLNAGLWALSKLPKGVVPELAYEVNTGQDLIKIYCDRDPDLIVLKRTDFIKLFEKLDYLRVQTRKHSRVTLSFVEAIELIVGACDDAHFKELASERGMNQPSSVNDGVNPTKLAG